MVIIYSSIDNPTHAEWINESNRLLNNLRNHLDYYTKKIKKYQKEEDDFMLKYYCLKLLDANKKLEMTKVFPSRGD